MSERYTTRRNLLKSGAVVGAVTLAGCADDDPPSDPDDGNDSDVSDDDAAPGADDDGADDADDGDEPGVENPTYEVWAFDQGTDTGYVYLGDETGALELDTEIDVGAVADVDADDNVVPHMVDFDSSGEYAAVACTAGARVLVFRTEDRELVGEIETGSGSHFAGFTPDDEYIQVDVIHESRIVRIAADLDAESFEIDDELVIADDPTFEERADEFSESMPICHDYDGNGYSYHTLGPSIHASGVVVVDVEDFTIESVFSPAEIRANCGTIHDPDRDQFFLTAGAPSNDEVTGGVGEWYVLDTEARSPIAPDGDVVDGDYGHADVSRETGGYDAHGFWFAGDELFVLNRETHDGVVIDPETLEVIDTVDDYGIAPDILWGTPGDNYLFATLRGPNPVSGDPHAAEGETPGISVFDVESREVIDVHVPNPDDSDSDFHGVAGRPL